MVSTLRKSERAQTWLLLIVLSAIWGSSYILIKKGIAVFTPAQVGTMRMSFAFLVLLPSALRNLGKIPPGKWKVFLFTGLVGNLIPSILFALAELNLASSVTGILNALTPLFGLVIAVYIFGFRINAAQTFGMALGFIGAVGLSLVGKEGGFGEMNIYVWLIVIATVCYAFSLNFIKAYLSGFSSITVTSMALFAIGPFALTYLFSTDFLTRLRQTPGALESVAYIAVLGIIGTAVALVLYTRLIQMTNPIVASLVTYLSPVVAIFWGLLDGEVLYPLHFAGMALILTGIYFVNRTGVKEREVKNEVISEP